MATLTSTRAAAGFQAAGGDFRVAWGTYDLAANPTAADIVELCKLPGGATVVGGWFMAEDIDTNATETLDIDLGWAANGVEAADPDGFGNFGVLTGDVVTGYTTTAGSYFPLQNVFVTGGPTSFSAETTIQAVVNANAATFAAGRITAVILYHTA